jgi:hypothetical protein
MPITGLTSLTEIRYADNDLAKSGNTDFRPTGASDTVSPDHQFANVAPDEPRTAVSETSGGEQFEAEELRRKGQVPRTSGADPAGPGTAGQQIGRVDADGRSDEAAARAMGDRSPERDEALPRESDTVREGRHSGGDKSAQPRSDRDSTTGDREG